MQIKEEITISLDQKKNIETDFNRKLHFSERTLTLMIYSICFSARWEVEVNLTWMIYFLGAVLADLKEEDRDKQILEGHLLIFLLGCMDKPRGTRKYIEGQEEWHSFIKAGEWAILSKDKQDNNSKKRNKKKFKIDLRELRELRELMGDKNQLI